MMEGMNREQASEAMKQAVIKTYSDMVFLDVAENPDMEIPAHFSYVLGIDILKPLSGTIVMYLSEDLKTRIVENIYYEPLKINQNDRDDCLLEILNVLAGSFLTIYFGKELNYKMKLPELFVDYLENGNDNFVLLNFNAEGLPFQVILKSVRYRY